MAGAVLAVAAAVATEALNHDPGTPPADRRGTAERVGPVPGPSPSCSRPREPAADAVASARPGDGEFRAVPADSVCSGPGPRRNEEGG